MRLKRKLFENQNVSLYKVTKDLGLEIKRLYRYADKTVDINKMPTELVLDLACYFHIEVNKFYNDMVEYLSK